MLTVGANVEEDKMIDRRLKAVLLKNLIEHALHDFMLDLLLFTAAPANEMMTRVRSGDFVGGFASPCVGRQH